MKREKFYKQSVQNLCVLVLCVLSATILSSVFVAADVFIGGNTNSDKFTIVDRTKVQNQVTTIVNSVNSQKIDVIMSMIYKDARPQLKTEIINSLKGKKISYEQTITKFTPQNSGVVRVDGLMYATVDGVLVSDREIFFTFQKYGNNWLLTDTNFHKQFTTSQLEYTVKKSFDRFLLAVIPIIIILELFWIWMIFDVSRRTLTDKALWVTVVVVLNFVGAAVYFLTVRAAAKEQERLSGVLYPSQQMPKGSAPPQSSAINSTQQNISQQASQKPSNQSQLPPRK